MTADRTRQELAAALMDSVMAGALLHGSMNHVTERMAEELLPVVERLQRQAAAKALREAAKHAGDFDRNPIYPYVTAGWLLDRADGIEAT